MSIQGVCLTVARLPVASAYRLRLVDRPTIGNTRVSVAYYSFYDNIQLYEPLGKALLFTSIS